ncbi:MAG: DUF3833 domain-containing protein [Rhodoferax sp.]|nr:DUF3833 domain-containing protein [Rhodoferax sp.]
MNRRFFIQRMSHSAALPVLDRSIGLAALAGSGALLTACAGPQVADYAAEKPALDLRTFFHGQVDAWGVFTDRSGHVVKRFKVLMDCQWQGDEGVLDEAFTYSDGTRQRRIWRLKALPNGHYVGRADDVIGEAAGQTKGNAFRWQYTLALPVNGTVWHVQFDDWMYLMDDQVLLNKAVMSKWGVRLGEVTLSFQRRAASPLGRLP